MSKPNKAALVHHAQTKSTWANCSNWRERWKEEVIDYGHLDYNSENIFEVKRYMESQGFIHVKDDPFKMMHNLPE